MGSPPFPWKQLIVLALCRICEPIAFMSIFPYVYYMVRSFDVTTNTKQLAVYVGMVTSAFAFAEFSSGVAWGRLSDRIGRKPVLLCGLAGTSLSMLIFGLAPNLPVALLGRAIGGLLNGNMGVLQTTVAEIVTVKEHQPRAYTIMPFVWCLGSILGPALGGALAQPSRTLPGFFPTGSLFDRYPFLLPNIVCAAILVCGVVVGLLFLEETHPEKKHRRDRGVEIGRGLSRRCRSCAAAIFGDGMQASDIFGLSAVLDEEIDGSHQSVTKETLSPLPKGLSEDQNATPKSSRSSGKAFTRHVILNIAGFGIMAYHSISFDQLMPVFLSEPVSYQPVSLPFHFAGGFGFSSTTIGFMLSVQGVYSLIAQAVICPYAVKRFGTLRTFRTVLSLWPLLYFLVPYTVLLPHPFQKPAVYACLLIKITFQVIAFPSNAILLTNSAPSTLVLGVINGVAASTASLARAFGPTVTGVVHAWGLTFSCAGLAWWISGGICFIGALQSIWMEEPTNGRMSQSLEKDEDLATSCEDALIDLRNEKSLQTMNVTCGSESDSKHRYSDRA